jgi:hypothetical protein
LDNPPTTSSSSSSAKDDPLADRFACPVKLTLRFPVYHRLTPQVRATHIKRSEKEGMATYRRFFAKLLTPWSVAVYSGQRSHVRSLPLLLSVSPVFILL